MIIYKHAENEFDAYVVASAMESLGMRVISIVPVSSLQWMVWAQSDHKGCSEDRARTTLDVTVAHLRQNPPCWQPFTGDK